MIGPFENGLIGPRGPAIRRARQYALVALAPALFVSLFLLACGLPVGGLGVAPLNGGDATSTPGSAAIAFVQANSAAPQAPQAAVAVPFIGAQMNGDLNVVIVGWNDTIAQVASVTDGTGNPYQLAVGPTSSGGSLSQSIYYAKNIGTAASGQNVVTVTFTAAAAYADIRVLEYSGIDQSNPLDVTAAASGSSANSISDAATTTNANDLLVGANMVSTLTSAPGDGYTARIITTPNGDIAEDRVVTSTDSYSAAAPLSAAGPWVMQMVAFRAATGGPRSAAGDGGDSASGDGDATSAADVSPESDSAGRFDVDGSGEADSGAVEADGVRHAVDASGGDDAPIDGGGNESGDVASNADANGPDAMGNPDAADTGDDAGPSVIPAFVQVNYEAPQFSGSALGVAYLTAQVAGDLNVVIVGWNDAVAQVTNVTDSAGNVYALAVGPTAYGSMLSQSIYYARNIAAAAANTVTIQFDQPAAYPDIRILEYSGLDATKPLEASASGVGAGTTANCGAVTTANVDLLVAATMVQDSTLKAGRGYTLRVRTIPDGDAVEDRVVASPGTYGATASLTGARGWIIQMAAFRAK